MAEDQQISQQSIQTWRTAVRSLVSRIRSGLMTTDPVNSSTIHPLPTESPQTDRIPETTPSHRMKSGPSTSPTTVTFVNKSEVHVQTYWVDYDGKEVRES